LKLENKDIVIVSVLCVMIVLGIHYQIKYTILNKRDVGVNNIRENIQKLITHLTWYKHLYLISIPAVTGVLYSFVHYLLFNLLIGSWINNPEFWIWESLVIPIVFMTYKFVQWLYNRMYGSHISSLKEYLQELREE